MTYPRTLKLLVAATDALNPAIRRLIFRAPNGSALPAFSAGAHIQVEVTPATGQSEWRHYSLVSFDTTGAALQEPHDYTIAVRREDEGRGGSRFMHKLRAGDTVTVRGPKNDFELRSHAAPALLLAGGIGVTPLISMATELVRSGRKVRMVYAGRSAESMAFLGELRTLLNDALNVHVDSEAGGPLDIKRMLDSCLSNEEVYVCGPKVLLDAVLVDTQARMWAPERVHFELFSAPEAQAGDHAFDVVLKQSGQSFRVPADQSILDCLDAHGCDVLADCRRGECGICAVNVFEGEIDHRDYVLTASEKTGGKVMQVCVSRAKGARLVLDL